MTTVMKAEQATYSIVDNIGRIIRNEKVVLTAGTNTVKIAVKGLAAGAYNLIITRKVSTEKLGFVTLQIILYKASSQDVATLWVWKNYKSWS